MGIKSLARRTFEQLFDLAGYDVAFAKQSVRELTVVDKNMWEPFYRNIDRIRLYHEAQQVTGMLDTDSFHRQLRYDSLQQTIKYVLGADIPGEFAECGCWKGLSAYITCHYITEYGGGREFHVFDSFEGGLSDKSSEDENLRYDLNADQTREEKLLFSSTEKNLHHALKGHENYRLYKGWIPERFEEVADQRYAFVNVDVDLYEPTRDSLEFFFPRLSSGGVIVCDDYNMSQFAGAKKAVDEFIAKNDISYFYEVPMGGCIIVKA